MSFFRTSRSGHPTMLPQCLDRGFQRVGRGLGIQAGDWFSSGLRMLRETYIAGASVSGRAAVNGGDVWCGRKDRREGARGGSEARAGYDPAAIGGKRLLRLKRFSGLSSVIAVLYSAWCRKRPESGAPN